MNEWLCRAGLLIAGAIHCLPLAGVGSGDALSRLYGFDGLSSGMELLLRHRAVLFGLLGALLIAAAWIPSLRAVAFIGGLISALSFLLMAGWPAQLSAPLARVWWADVIAVAALAVAFAADSYGSRLASTVEPPLG